MRFSLPAVLVGVLMLGIALFQAVTGHPPFTFFEAFILAALFVVLGAIGGFEWAFFCLIVQALVAFVLRDATSSAFWLFCIACMWYVGVTLLAVHGSRVLMGISAGVLFVGLLIERVPTFSLAEWMVFIGLLLLEVSLMYLAGNALRGRWFSPYA